MLNLLKKYGFVFWLSIITIRYIATSLEKIPRPYEMTAILCGVILLCTITPYLFKNRIYMMPATLSWVLLIALTVAPLLGGTIQDILFFCWIFILSQIIGTKILVIIVKKFDLSWLETFVLTTAIGFNVFSLLIFGLSVFHILYTQIIYAVFLFLTLVFSTDILRFGKEVYDKGCEYRVILKNVMASPFLSAIIAISLIMITVNFIVVLAPEVQYDALNYHLTVSKLYIANHGTVNLPNIMQSYFAKSTEMLYVLGMMLSGQIAAKLFSFAFGILSALTIFSIGKRYFSLEIGILGAVLFYMMPMTGWLSTTTYNELAITFYILLTAMVFLLWQKSKNKELLFLCGILAAGALSAKLYAILFLLPIGCLVLFFCWQFTQGRFRNFFNELAIFIAPTLLLTFPWIWITYAQTGNPLFPFFNALFKSNLLPHSNNFMNLATFGFGESLKSFLTTPWNITYFSSKYVEAHDGVMGILMLTSLPGLLFLRKSSVTLFIFLINLCALAIWFFIGQYARYLMPAYAFFALVSAYLFYYFFNYNKEKLFIKRILQVLILIYLFFTIPIYLSSFVKISNIIPYKVVFGIQTKDEYLTKALGIYPAALYLNKQYRPNEIKIFLVGPEYRYYIDAPVYNTNSLNMQDFPFNANPSDIISYIKNKGITHILIDTHEKNQLWYTRFVKPQYMQVEFTSDRAILYKLLP